MVFRDENAAAAEKPASVLLTEKAACEEESNDCERTFTFVRGREDFQKEI